MSLVDSHPVSEIGSLRPRSKRTIEPTQEAKKKRVGIRGSESVIVGGRTRMTA